MRHKRIYLDEYDQLHDGMKRMAASFNWEVIERPTDVSETDAIDPRLVTLESLGLAPRIAEELAPLVCETCANRNNPTGDGPCVSCDLTVDGPASNYSAEADELLSSSELDDFARSAIEDDEDGDEDGDET